MKLFKYGNTIMDSKYQTQDVQDMMRILDTEVELYAINDQLYISNKKESTLHQIQEYEHKGRFYLVEDGKIERKTND
jgi:sulfur transfer complex TusBCD TusB component (DsrH family)